MGECRETANFVMASAENLYSNIQLWKAWYFDASAFFRFFSIFNRGFHTHRYDHTSWGRSENKLLNYPSFTSVCTKYGLYYSIVIILYNANVLLIGQFIWFQDSITLFSPATTREQATTIDIRVLLNALARVLLLRLISPVLFLLLFLLLVY